VKEVNENIDLVNFRLSGLRRKTDFYLKQIRRSALKKFTFSEILNFNLYGMPQRPFDPVFNAGLVQHHPVYR
jgi:hypothetical protein